jgi:NAD(P)-dependent dehydrogenase (short-subunit alcohol dehydrogenase family)
MFQLNGKVAVVTGGGSGIGKAIAFLFAKQGAAVYIFDVDEVGANQAATDIATQGGEAFTLEVNISDQKAVKQAVQQVIDAKGRIDILLNNAGVAHVGTADSTNEEDFTRLFNINVKGVYNCLHEILPHMKAQQHGVILNMCSIAASVGITDRFAYSMSKGAVLGMTLSTARDYLAYNIRCNCISPARIYTPFVEGFISKNYPGKEEEMFDKLSKSQPIGRMGTPDEIAHLALYLCSSEAGFITGCDYPIDGGFIKLNN